MSTSGHLFLRGAPHLALVSLGGGGEERGGEKRLAEWNRAEVWRREALQGRKSTPHGWTVVHVIDSSSYFGSGGERAGGRGDSCQRSWQRRESCFPALEGISFTLFLKRCSHLYPSWTFGCGWQHCSRSQSPSIEMCWSGQQKKCTFLMSQDTSRELLLERGEARPGILVFFSMFSLCHLGSHCRRCNFIIETSKLLKCQKMSMWAQSGSTLQHVLPAKVAAR